MRPEPVNCDRCGRVLGNQSAYANHKRVCSILPPGMELVEEFREDHDLTITSMAERYGVSTSAITTRLIHGGVSQEERIRRGSRARSYALSLSEDRRSVACKRCDIIVEIQTNGYCIYCNREGVAFDDK